MMPYRGNTRLNYEIERQIGIWDGTIWGFTIKKMYENGCSYEDICDQLDIDYEDYKED